MIKHHLQREAHRSALKAALIYFVLGALWILVSDGLLGTFFPAAPALSLIQTIKGWGYVAITAILAYVLVRRYLTRILLMEDRLRQQQKLETIGTLAAGIAHEINNPVSVIMNSAELIARQTTDPKLSRYAGYILQETEHVTGIVHELLHLARQEGQEDFQTLQPTQLLDAASGLVETILHHDHIIVHKEIAEDAPAVLCHPRQIQQVMLNLLTNARDALNERFPRPDPGKQLAISCTCGTLHHETALRIDVRDHGIGISPEATAQIFEAFFTTKMEGAGTGLGLSISHSIVKEHGGQLTCQSKPGEGTTFTILLPTTPKVPADAQNQPGS